MDEVESGAAVASGITAETSFDQAVLRERPRLYALAHTILQDAGEAEDAVQETLVSAWRKWSQLNDQLEPAAWLTRICVNQCLRHRRFKARFGPPSGLVAASRDPNSEFEDRLLDFGRAFKKLSSRQRAIFALHVQHGYTLDECAALVGCRPGTARSHLGRAVAKLRKEMGNG